MRKMEYVVFGVLLSLASVATAAPVTILGYTFDDSAENLFEGIIVEYDISYPNGVGEGALDVVTSGGVNLFDIDTNNPSNVDASVVGFLDAADNEIPTPTAISFDVYDAGDNFLGTFLAGTLTPVSGNEYTFTVTGGDASSYFTSGPFVYDSTISSGDFVDDAFTLTMTATPNPALVTILGYTFDSTAENIFEGIIVEYDISYPNGVGDGALDVVTSGGVNLFDIDTNNPSNVDASVVGFLDAADNEIPTPAAISFDVYDAGDNFIGTFLAGTLTAVSGNEYTFTVTGGDAAGYFTGGSFVYDSTISSGDFVDDAFTLTMTASPGMGSPVASILPTSRSVQVGSAATAFSTVINAASVTATGCGIAPLTNMQADFFYQTTDPATNALVGTPNTPVDIAAGALQTYLFSFTPTAAFNPTDVALNFDCSNSNPAPVTTGLNTLLLSASSTPVPDIVALAASPTGDGIIDLPGTNGSNAFSVATVNVGSTATITASPAPSVTLPLVMSICETNPATGACLSGPGSSATSSVAGGATPTYSVFVSGAGTVPFDPANNRIIVEFKDAGGVVRGSTSAAVRTL